jgi:cation diffusion facilitator family transporter
MERRDAVRRVGVVVLSVNLVLAVGKALVWWSTGSIAVGSEAVNSAADTVYSVVVLAGLYLSTQPADPEHPHGHERIEPFVSLFVAFGVFVAGGTVLYQSITALLAGDVSITAGPWAVGILVVSGVAKFGLYRYCLGVAEGYNSPATNATALDNRNDILTAGAALVGVLGAAAGFPFLDPLAGAVVALAIVYTGYDIARDNLNYLVGAAPSHELREEILSRALSHPQVHGAHDVVAHYVGPEVDVSLHIEVEGDLTLLEAHEIESALAEDIHEIPTVDDVFVHIDPRELDEWKESERVESQ